MKTRRSNRYRKLLIRVSYRVTYRVIPPPANAHWKRIRIAENGEEVITYERIIKNEEAYQRALELEKQ